MRKVLLLSPHYDDAVLGAGQFMAGRPDVEVVTIFNWRSSDANVQTTYDAKCGFSTADEAVHARKAENEAALALLKATSIDVNVPDAQYGAPRNQDEFVLNRILGLIDKDYEFILAPIGLGHPDHIQTSSVAILLQNKLNIPLYMWEDIPLRVTEPELIWERIQELTGQYHVNFTRDKVGDGPMTEKIRALLCYKSQIGTGILDPWLIYTPERFWRIDEKN